MDERMRRLARQASMGDPDAEKALEAMRERTGLCPLHGFPARDPAGWRHLGGEGCEVCEEDLYCGSGECGSETCHHCYPRYLDCEYGHPVCDYGDDQPVIDAPELEECPGCGEMVEDPDDCPYCDDDGRNDCWSCQGTGIGYPVDRSCSACGGSGIPRRSRYDDYVDPGDYYDRYYDDEPYDPY